MDMEGQSSDVDVCSGRCLLYQNVYTLVRLRCSPTAGLIFN